MKNTKKITSDMASDDLSDYDERVYVDIVSVGFAKLVTKIVLIDPKSWAKQISKKGKFMKGFAAAVDHVVSNTQNESFRQHHIKSRLLGYIHLENSEISNVMESITRIGIRKPPMYENGWANPGRKPVGIQKISGPNKIYHPTTFDKNLRTVLANPKTLDMIYSLSVESNLLHQLLKHLRWVAIRAILLNKFNREKAWNVCKSVFPLTEQEFELDFEKVQSLDEKELENIASTSAKLFMEQHIPENYRSIFYIGAYYFPTEDIVISAHH